IGFSDHLNLFFKQSLQIKEEQEELWTNQEGEQHNGLKVTDVTTFPFTIVTVKSEDDDKEKSQSLQLHQSQTEDNSEMEPLTSSPAKQVKTEPDEEDCGGPESEGNLDTHIYLQPKTDVKASDSSETEVSNDDDDWKEPVSDSGPKTRHSDDVWKVSRELESGIKSQGAFNILNKSFSCSECDKEFLQRQSLQKHMTLRKNVESQRTDHTEEKPFGCNVCETTLRQRYSLDRDMRVHTGEETIWL
uniref:C2H2-type domain-containing protein n=1 Tax=Pundamilia nyererei TaxID=303518 RepID=A0A3B4GE18_9CICH